MGKKKRGNYNQDHFKVGGSIQPGGDIVQEREKGKVSKQSPAPSRQSPEGKRQKADPRHQTPEPQKTDG